MMETGPAPFSLDQEGWQTARWKLDRFISVYTNRGGGQHGGNWTGSFQSRPIGLMDSMVETGPAHFSLDQ